MNKSGDQPIVINGWSIFAHPIFLTEIEELLIQVNDLRQKYPQDYKRKNATKRLAAIMKLAFNDIPQDPTRSDYRQGLTLGNNYKHWFRAKFFQQYRLFFRYHQESKTIVYSWVNDEDSKRAYESNTDTYRVFRKMLESGDPPDNWDDLLEIARGETNRLEKVIKTDLL